MLLASILLMFVCNRADTIEDMRADLVEKAQTLLKCGSSGRIDKSDNEDEEDDDK